MSKLEKEIEEVFEILSPELVELMSKFDSDKHEVVLMAISTFGVFYLGQSYGTETARGFLSLMLERVDEINAAPAKKIYHA